MRFRCVKEIMITLSDYIPTEYALDASTSSFSHCTTLRRIREEATEMRLESSPVPRRKQKS
jgi:hypothetical protein